MKELTLGAHILLWNEAPLLIDMLDNIYPLVDQIVVVEGSWTDQTDGKNLRSDDGTLELLGAYPDPENKIVARYGTGDEADARNQALLSTTTDYILNVAADERWTHDAMKTLRQRLAWSRIYGGRPSCFRIFARTFYFNHEWFMWEDPLYVWERTPDLKFTGLVASNKDNLRAWANVEWFHFAYIGRERVKRKLDLYIGGDIYYNEVFSKVPDNPTAEDIELACERNREIRGVPGMHLIFPNVTLASYTGKLRFDHTVSLFR